MRLAASAEEGAGLVIALCLPGSQAPASQASGFGSAPFFRRRRYLMTPYTSAVARSGDF